MLSCYIFRIVKCMGDSFKKANNKGEMKRCQMHYSTF